MSGDSTVVVTLSEPIASFPEQAVSGLTVVNGGHTIARAERGGRPVDADAA